MEFHRSGAAARGRRGDHQPARRARSERRRPRPTATASPSSGSVRTATRRTKVVAYGIAYDLNLFSNFTYYLDDPVHGDQIEQADHRFVTGGKVSYRRLAHWGGHQVQNTVGVQVRNDDITNAAFTARRRGLLDTAGKTPSSKPPAVYAQNEIEWAPWLRTMAGLRVDGERFHVNALDPANSGTRAPDS